MKAYDKNNIDLEFIPAIYEHLVKKASTLHTLAGDVEDKAVN